MSVKRIQIVGVSGSGKSTLARQISAKTGLVYIDTDSLYWGDDWKLCTDREVLERIDLESGSWVIDGNFDSLWQEVWTRSDLIVWLRVPRITSTARVFRRNLGWCLSESDWNGRRMRLRSALSGVLHAFRSHRRKEIDYPKRLASTGVNKAVVLKSNSDVKRFLLELESWDVSGEKKEGSDKLPS